MILFQSNHEQGHQSGGATIEMDHVMLPDGSRAMLSESITHLRMNGLDIRILGRSYNPRTKDVYLILEADQKEGPAAQWPSNCSEEIKKEDESKVVEEPNVHDKAAETSENVERRRRGRPRKGFELP